MEDLWFHVQVDIPAVPDNDDRSPEDNRTHVARPDDFPFQRAGRAILFTTLLLLGAFSVYAFAALKPLRYFGAIACLAFLAAFLADVVLLPALLRLWPRSSEVKQQSASDAEG